MQPELILDFWFGPLDTEGRASPALSERWWRKDEALDREVRARFEPAWTAAMGGECDGWLAEPRTLLAYVILLDQLSRNMFRGEPRSFAGDARALSAAQAAVARGFDGALSGDERLFLYMPFMHSEELALQEQCVALLTRFRDATSSGALRAALESNVRFAEQHRDIIARWGRFPHRNAILGRSSSAAELEFLKGPNSSF